MVQLPPVQARAYVCWRALYKYYTWSGSSAVVLSEDTNLSLCVCVYCCLDTTPQCCRPCRPATRTPWRWWGTALLPDWAPTWRHSSSSSRTNPAPPTPIPLLTTTPPAGGTCPCWTSSPASEAEIPPTCLPGRDLWMTMTLKLRIRQVFTITHIHMQSWIVFPHWCTCRHAAFSPHYVSQLIFAATSFRWWFGGNS